MRFKNVSLKVLNDRGLREKIFLRHVALNQHFYEV